MGVAQMFAYDAYADVDSADVGAWHGQTSWIDAWSLVHFHQHSHSPMEIAIENCYRDADAGEECDVVNELAFDWPDAYPLVSMALRR